MVRNLNKHGGQHSLYRGSGALGFLGVSRAGWLFGRVGSMEEAQALWYTARNESAMIEVTEQPRHGLAQAEPTALDLQTEAA